MTKAATENDRNVSTKTGAATFENNLGSVEVSAEKVWKTFGYFDARKSDYLMGKVNFPDNTLFYFNQLYLPSRRTRKFFTVTTLPLAKQIVESSKPSSGCFLLHLERERSENGQAML